jgi:hypothetical protein
VNAGALQQALGAGASYVYDGWIGDDLIEDRLDGRDFDQLIAAVDFLHALDFFVERELLVMVIVLEAMSEFERN